MIDMRFITVNTDCVVKLFQTLWQTLQRELIDRLSVAMKNTTQRTA